MSLLGKILVVIQTLLALLFLGVQGTLYYHQNDWREATIRTQKRYTSVVSTKNEQIGRLQSDLGDEKQVTVSTRQQLELYQGELKATEDKIKDLVNKETELRSDHDDLKRDHTKIVGTISEKDAQISDYLGRIAQLEDELKEASSDKELAQAQVARLIQQRAALEKDLGESRRLQTKAEQLARDRGLLIEEVQRQGFPITTMVGNFPPAAPVRAKVAGVDTSVQPSLVLLSAGAEDGVKRGYTFTVYRGDTFVGKVVVSRLMADSVGCRVLFTAPGQTIQQGDDAATVLD